MNNKILIAALPALLAGCSMMGGGDTAPAAPSGRPAPGGPMVPDSPVLIGAPYSVGGNRYTPADVIDYDEVGYASWYGAELDGRPTANGETFLSARISAAHRTLPIPSYVEVTRLDTGRTILVRINDRGPADSRRLIDLSAAAAEQLGIAENGLAQVRVRRTNPIMTERMALRSGQSVPARLDTPESLLTILRERAARLPVPAGYRAPVARPASRPANPATTNPAPVQPVPAPAPTGATSASDVHGFVVQLGAFSSRERAEALARRYRARVDSAGDIHRVRIGPFETQDEAEAAAARVRGAGQPGAVVQRIQ